MVHNLPDTVGIRLIVFRQHSDLCGSEHAVVKADIVHYTIHAFRIVAPPGANVDLRVGTEQSQAACAFFRRNELPIDVNSR